MFVEPWTEARVQDIASDAPRSITIGPFGSRLKAELYVADGFPVIRGQDIGPGKGLLEDNLVYVPEAVAESLSGCIVSEGDLIFPHRGAIGQVGIVGQRQFLLSSSMMKLTCNRTVIDPGFLFYYFRGPGRDELLTRASTVGTPGIGQPLKSLRGIPIRYPGLPKQQAIAEVLGALDDKIAANTKVAQVARDLAGAEYQNMLSRVEETTILQKVLTLEYGKPLLAATRVPGQVQVFGSGGIVGFHNQTFTAGPGVVVGRKGTAGAVHWADSDYYPIDTTFYVKSINPDVFSLVYCFYLLRSLKLTELNSDSAVPGLNRNDAYALKIRLPSDALIQEFTRISIPLINLAGQAERESATLAATRDALLPQLMSGKLRVRDAETAVEAVV